MRISYLIRFIAVSTEIFFGISLPQFSSTYPFLLYLFPLVKLHIFLFFHRGNLAGKGMEAGGGGTICDLQTDYKSVWTSGKSVFCDLC